MKTFTKTNLALMLSAALLATATMAQEKSDEELADMSDPLAVYTQAGGGLTDRGINLKIGESYDTGSDTTMGMNIIELKGIGGDWAGWSGSSKRDNSIDFFRFRNFEVDMTNGRGQQMDLNYNVEREDLSASYSFIQALPAWGSLQLYPLAGMGVSIQNNAIDGIDDNGEQIVDSGYSMPGAYAVVGMYGRYILNEKIWFNYNPMWLTSVAGSDFYQDNTYGVDNSNILLHEVVASYQINPRLNVRYFANFSDEIKFSDGEHRIEVNYQF